MDYQIQNKQKIQQTGFWEATGASKLGLKSKPQTKKKHDKRRAETKKTLM